MGTSHANFSKQFQYSESKCSFCGKSSWTGDWRGNIKLILVCRTCAIETLPALFADATWYPAWSPYDGAHDLERLASRYWKAQAINVTRSGGAK